LFELVMMLRLLEMHMGWKIHLIHVAGMRMIEQDMDGLSCGDMVAGVMGGADMLSFIPLCYSALERQPNLHEWVYSWWGGKWLTPEGWFDVANQTGLYMWCPPPAVAEVALEQL
jgi:hypothetical protein